MSENSGSKWFQKNPRAGGALVMAASWAVAAFVYLKFLRDAEAGVTSLSIPSVFAALVSIGSVGLIVLVGGKSASDAIQKMGEGPKDWKVYLFLAILLAPGMLAFAWVKYKLASLGYQ